MLVEQRLRLGRPRPLVLVSSSSSISAFSVWCRPPIARFTRLPIWAERPRPVFLLTLVSRHCASKRRVSRSISIARATEPVSISIEPLDSPREQDQPEPDRREDHRPG
jgi:hypothetical protein